MNWHDVDEDARTISLHGGEWIAGSNAGIAYRFMTLYPSYAADTVVSRLIYLS